MSTIRSFGPRQPNQQLLKNGENIQQAKSLANRKALGNVKNIVSENDQAIIAGKSTDPDKAGVVGKNDKSEKKPKGLKQRSQPNVGSSENADCKELPKDKNFSVDNNDYYEMSANKYDPLNEDYKVGLLEIERMRSMELEDDGLSVPFPVDNPDDFWFF